MFKGKAVIVTGSSSGIGAHAAVRFAEQGAHVTIHGRKADALQKVKEQCSKAADGNNKVHVVVGDIANEEVRKELIDGTVKAFGKLDVLVNNAAIYNPNSFSESTIEIYDDLFKVNVRSTIALTQLAMPHLIKSKGNIVNISSDVGLKAVPWAVFYALTKATLDHFTKCLAIEFGPKGVRINSVNPGYIPETAVLSRAGINDAEQQEYIRMASESFPLKRPGKLDEVSNAILYLASDKASFCTGVLLPVDGGSSTGPALTNVNPK